MRLRPVLAIVRHDWRILSRERGPVIVLIAMPLVITGFLRPVYRRLLQDEGYRHANGAEQAVPGLSVMFAFFLVSYVGFAFFREHGWKTWDRIRASSARPSEVLIGKLLVPLMLGVVQQLVLMTAGVLLYGMQIRGSLLALGVVSVALLLSLIAFGMVLVAWCRTVQQISSYSYLSAMLIGGLGGALTPLPLMPAWARAVAPFMPSYWALRGYQAVILDGAALRDVLSDVAVLLVFAAALGGIALRRYRSDEAKTAWA